MVYHTIIVLFDPEVPVRRVCSHYLYDLQVSPYCNYCMYNIVGKHTKIHRKHTEIHRKHTEIHRKLTKIHRKTYKNTSKNVRKYIKNVRKFIWKTYGNSRYFIEDIENGSWCCTSWHRSNGICLRACTTNVRVDLFINWQLKWATRHKKTWKQCTCDTHRHNFLKNFVYNQP